MTLRLGFLGCGKWARKLAGSFRACGAEVVCHDRAIPMGDVTEPLPPGYMVGSRPAVIAGQPGASITPILPGFGARVPWRDQLADKSIDAIVAVAPPEVTTEVALACAAAGKPVMATKPLFDHPERITAPFYVDFWRLWSGAHQEGRGLPVPGITMLGYGPFRSFPGAFDYGPHVVAAAMDWCSTTDLELTQCIRIDPSDYEGYEGNGGEQFQVGFRGMGRSVTTSFGNGAPNGIRILCGHEETPTHVGDEPKEAIMQKFCRAFMADVSEGFVSTDLLNYSREGMRLLREIRERAK